MFKTLDRSIEQVCKAYDHRSRIQATIKIEQISGDILKTKPGSDEFKALMKEFCFYDNLIQSA